jgi:hypothetical protein
VERDEYISKTLISGVITFAITDAIARVVWNSIKANQTPGGPISIPGWLPHHYQIGLITTAAGAIGHSRSWSPWVLGSGLGMLAGDMNDAVALQSRF